MHLDVLDISLSESTIFIIDSFGTEMVLGKKDYYDVT